MLNFTEVNTNTPRDCTSCKLYELMNADPSRGNLKTQAISGWCKSHCTVSRNWQGWLGSEEILRNQLTRPFVFSKVAPPKLVSLIRKQGKLSVFSRASIEQGLGIRFPLSVHTLGHVDAYLRENPPFLALASVNFEIKPGCLNGIDWPGFCGRRTPPAASAAPIEERPRIPVEREFRVPVNGNLELFAMTPSYETWEICHEEFVNTSWLADYAQEMWDQGITREDRISTYLCEELSTRFRHDLDEEGVDHPSLSFLERHETGDNSEYPNGTAGFDEFNAFIDSESTGFRAALSFVLDTFNELREEAEAEEGRI